MRKRYILLKDTPEVKAGAILEEECDEGTQDFKVIEGKNPLELETGRRVIYYRKFVIKQPEWFQEVQQLWLTPEEITKVKKILKK
jgi:hypothetical protein